MAVCSRKTAIVVIGISLSVLLLTIVLTLQFDGIYRRILYQQVTLREGSRSYELWRNVGLGFRTGAKFYFFNITNPDEVLSGDRPEVREMGPYTYRTEWVRDNVTFNGNGTVTFRQKITFYFDEEESEGLEDDIVTSINVPYVAASHQMKAQNMFMRRMGYMALNKLGQRLLIRRTVRELTFQGYPDVLVKFASRTGHTTASSGFGNAFRTGFRAVVDALKHEPDDSRGKFAYMADKNGTYSQMLTMFTGDGDIRLINNVQLLNGDTHVSVWAGEPCNHVKGSFGNVRPPLNTSNEESIFIPDLFRSLQLSYSGSSVVGRLKARRFSISEKALASSKIVPENTCYSSADRRELPSGLADLGPLRKGAPIVMSLPHFLSADASLLHEVRGLRPNAAQHMLYIDSEPVTGVTLTARARIQLNVLLERIPGFGPFGSVQNCVVPLFWQETSADARGSTLRNIRMAVMLPTYLRMVAVSLFVLSGVSLVAAIAVIIRNMHYRSRKISGNIDGRSYSKESGGCTLLHTDPIELIPSSKTRNYHYQKQPPSAEGDVRLLLQRTVV